MSCHWSCDPRWVKISGHSEQLGPCGSTSHLVNNRHSRVKTWGASCIGGFGQTDGPRKFELGIPQSRGASHIRGASYIRDKRIIILWQCFPPAKPKELLRGEKGWLTYVVGHNSWWHMKCAQHAAHNPKFKKMGSFRLPWWLKVATTLEKPHPPPTIQGEGEMTMMLLHNNRSR